MVLSKCSKTIGIMTAITRMEYWSMEYGPSIYNPKRPLLKSFQEFSQMECHTLGKQAGKVAPPSMVINAQLPQLVWNLFIPIKSALKVSGLPISSQPLPKTTTIGNMIVSKKSTFPNRATTAGRAILFCPQADKSSRSKPTTSAPAAA